MANDADSKPHHFKPGQSGNPGGRARMPAEIKDMLKCATVHATKRCIEALDATKIVHYKGVEVGTYVDHDMRLRAFEAIFNRLYGRPVQEVAGEDGGPIRIDMGLLERLQRLAPKPSEGG